MKVELFLVRHDEYEGLYTKSELEELKQEVIEDYRTDDIAYSQDIYDVTMPYSLVQAALGVEIEQNKIQETAKSCEEQYWEDFYMDWIDEYEKEI